MVDCIEIHCCNMTKSKQNKKKSKIRMNTLINFLHLLFNLLKFLTIRSCNIHFLQNFHLSKKKSWLFFHWTITKNRILGQAQYYLLIFLCFSNWISHAFLGFKNRSKRKNILLCIFQFKTRTNRKCQSYRIW